MTTGPGPAAARRRAPSFQQLYYTSCEHGISGFSGFQFNALSEGVTAETRQTVEALAGYEPPRVFAESDTPALLARCPVNLCFRPEPGTGRSGTALCVQYVGRDSARRFGNYFAHALHSADFAAAARGLLAIELWGSPVWTAQPSPSIDIPVLAAPARGPLDTRAVAAFLAGHPHADRLPQLLAAVLNALTDHASVVVADDTTDRVAHWFAAVSYLLPPPLARRLSFATYVFRPARSSLHLIGTVPEARLDFGPDEEDGYAVFDFSRARFPPPPPAEPGVAGLVALLDRIGTGSARSVWAWTVDFADGREQHPADWHAPLAAAASSGGITLAPADVDALLGWLPSADHLGPRRPQIAADLHLRHRSLDEPRLAALSDIARDAGDTELHREIEGRLHESRMRVYMTAADTATAPVPVTDPAVRVRATAEWQRMLAAEAATTRHRVRLLLWARGAGLDPPQDVVTAEMLDVARTLLGSSVPGAALRQEVARLTAAQRGMQHALVTALEEVLVRGAVQGQLFAQFPADLLREHHLTGRPLLLEHYWRARAEREPRRRVALMLKILELRGTTAPDADLLRDLWPGGSAAWTHREATEAVSGMLPEALRDEAVAVRLRGALAPWIDTEEQLDDFIDLCRLLTAPVRLHLLPQDVRQLVATTLTLANALEGEREASRLVAAFTIPETESLAGPRALKRFRLIPAMLQRPADPGVLGKLLPDAGSWLLKRYLPAVRDAAGAVDARVGDVLLSHVAAVAVTGTRRVVAQADQELMREIRNDPSERWQVRDLERLADAVRPYYPGLADHYLEYAKQRRAERKVLGKLPSLLSRHRSGRIERDARGDTAGPDGGRGVRDSHRSGDDRAEGKGAADGGQHRGKDREGRGDSARRNRYREDKDRRDKGSGER